MTAIVPPTDATLEQAAALLRQGGLVAFPTETVYGLGADAGSDRAVARLYEAKGRPRFNPLIAHVPTTAAALREGRFSAAAQALAEAFWPGPMTLVVPVADAGRVSRLARAGLDSVALRVPAHAVAQALLRRTGVPVVAPSANRSGGLSPTTAAHVEAGLAGRIDAVIDGGACPLGLESTILACLVGDPVLLRPGALPREAIEAVLGRPLAQGAVAPGAPVAPGQLASHYAPRARLQLHVADAPAEGAALLDFGGRLAPWRTGRTYDDLSATGDLREAAARLFAALHALDASGAALIGVAPVPMAGLGLAINDRLARAAAPRPV